MYYKTILFMLIVIVGSLWLIKGLDFVVNTYDITVTKNEIKSEPYTNEKDLYTQFSETNEEDIKNETDTEINSELPTFEYEYQSADRWESLFDPHEIIRDWPMIGGSPLDEYTMIVTLGNPKINWNNYIDESMDPDELPIPEGEEFNALYCVFTMGYEEEELIMWLVGYSYYKGETPYVYTIDEEKEVYKAFNELEIEEDSESCLRSI